MRAIYIPHTSSPDSLATDHSYGWATGFFLKWMKRREDLFVTWIVPRGALTEQRDAFYKLEDYIDRFKFIEVDMASSQIAEQGILPKELLEEMTFDLQEHYFDVIFCEKPGILGLFAAGINLPKQNRKYKTFISNFHYAMDGTKETDVTYFVEANYFMNASMSDAYLFACDDRCNIDSWGQFKKKINKYCSSSHVSKCMEKPRWVKAACDYDEVKEKRLAWEAEGNKKPDDEFRIQYAYSVSMNFNFKRVSALVNKYQLVHPDVKYVITTPSEIEHEKFDDRTEFHGKCPRPKFFDIALTCHCSVMWTDYAAGLNHGSVLEMTALGVLPIFYKSAIPFPWDETYPFTFTNDAEFMAVIKSVKNNYDKPLIQDWIQKNHELLDETFSTRSGNDLVIDWIEKDIEEKFSGKDILNPWASCVSDLPKDEYTMKEIADIIKRDSVVHADLTTIIAGAQRYRWTTLDNIRTWMLQNGWIDSGSGEETLLKRKSSDG